jgi:inhibitor of KinA
MSDLRIVAAGDAALVAEFADRIDATVNARSIALAGELITRPFTGVRDVVPTFRSVAVYFDPLTTDVERLADRIREAAEACGETAERSPRMVEIPVCYDREFAEDIEDVARFGGMDHLGVVAAHTARQYRVFMLGFLPGFAYLGTVDDRIAAPRRGVPRASVPAGAVGIAGRQTGIYPAPSPGGWNIIGRTPLRMLALDREPPALLAAGDTVRFRPIERLEFDRLAATESRV